MRCPPVTREWPRDKVFAYCAGNAVDPVEAVDTMRAAGVEPLEPYPGSHAPWRCRCLTCGREVTPRYGLVSRDGGGCRYCASRAVDPAEAVDTMRRAGAEPLEPYLRYSSTLAVPLRDVRT